MTNVLVDVNIFMDVLTKREGWKASIVILECVRKEKIKGIISAITPPILWFLLSKEFSEAEAKEITYDIIKGFEIADLSSEILHLALKSEFEDFEDGIQYYSAKSSDCRVIITRNKDDFSRSN